MQREIAEQVRERRDALGKDAAMSRALRFDAAHWGLALSGGGIRSATFCFGLLRAFARNGLLLRFDLLSTVSGGGYVGAMLGRLIQRATDLAALRVVLDAVAGCSNTWMTEWLRSNGRYLTPSGYADRLYAAAVFARALLAVHLELGVIGLFFGALSSGLDLVVWKGLDVLVRWLPGLEDMTLWRNWINVLPTAWVLLPLCAAALSVLAVSYQAVPMAMRPWWVRLGVGLCAAGVLSVLCLDHALTGASDNVGADARRIVVGFGIAISVGWLVAVPIASAVVAKVARAVPVVVVEPRRADIVLDTARTRLTFYLATTFKVAAWILLAGAIDRSAWWLAYEVENWHGAGVALAVAAAVARGFVPLFGSITSGSRGDRYLLPVANLLGRLLTFAVFAWWMAVVHRTVLSEIFAPDGPHLGLPVWLLCTLAAVCLLYMLATGWDVQFLNLSSLHPFYRARLARSYLGAANPHRFPPGRDEAWPAVRAATTAPSALDEVDKGLNSIRDVDPGDDLPIFDYAPHRAGGPVHLINVCANETRGPRTRLFNSDRRGRLLTVAPGGLVRLGGGPWRPLARDQRALMLGAWMAISGAAVASALGARTRAGISALAMFAGARLGHWWDSTALQAASAHPRRWAWWRPRLFGKSFGLLRELLGRFTIVEGNHWYLTDGGHFENTGAYALLAQRCSFIVLADCGADPRYAFDNLEGVVRKARIDLQCEVRMLRPRSDLPVGDAGRAIVADYGSLNELASNNAQCCLALARVDYLDTPPSHGHLVLVKPNLCQGLPVDLFNFKKAHPDFPQQSTANQFFDEAQWESYFQLGQVLGQKLTRERVDAILRSAADWFVDDDGFAAGGAAAGTTASPAATSRLPTRIAAAGAVSASLGIGAFATAGVATWQAIDAWRVGQSQKGKDDDAAMKELTALWAQLPAADRPASDAGAAAALAASLARESARMCEAGSPNGFERSPLATDILAGARAACARFPPAGAPPSCLWLDAATRASGAGSRATCIAEAAARIDHGRGNPPCFDYWAYDYRRNAPWQCANAGFSAVRAAGSAYAARTRLYTVEGSGFAETGKEGICSGYTVRPLIYGATEAGVAKALAERWNGLGAVVRPTQNLVAKAAVEGRPPPFALPAGIHFATAAAERCADAMQRVSVFGKRPGLDTVRDPASEDGVSRPWAIDVVLTPSP